MGPAFVKHSGYLEWAASNNLVVLFPQVKLSKANNKGCWDFKGLKVDPEIDETTDQYCTRDGAQVAAIKRMVDRLAVGDYVSARL
mmetsp:Transcript_29887/g.45697  ORF Transcript_29887/g.45697 Transcript_29887/m.45697 type:complete len:85 (-) Transcript_29887:44-298(-)